MTDPYIGINGTKIEVFDNDLSAVRTIKQLDEVTLAGVEVLTNKTLTSPVINTSVSGTAGFLKSKIIVATRDMTAASGDVAYTGLDFTPTSIQVMACIPGVYTFAQGMADSAKTYKTMCTTAAGIFTAGSTMLLALFTATGANSQIAIVKTYNINTGFTLTWTKAGSPTGTADLYFLCFR